MEKKTVSLPDKNSSDIIIELKEQYFQINEITVTPKNNPAIRIIRKALQNKAENNYERYPDYSYQCYLKIVSDAKQSPDLRQTEKDTVSEDSKSSGANWHLISENLILSTRVNNRNTNKIIATKTSGINSPVFSEAMLFTFPQSISFYNNSISIFGSIETSGNQMLLNYISPLANNCLSAYNYQLENTFVNENDTVFEIIYFPKKNKNFNALSGKIFISSENYAISDITAESVGNKHIDFRFKQEYAYIKGKWFPTKLEHEIVFKTMPIKTEGIKTYLSYYTSSWISNVEYGSEYPAERYSEEITEYNTSKKSTDTLMDESILSETIETLIDTNNVAEDKVYEKSIKITDQESPEKQAYRLEQVYVDEKMILKSDSLLHLARPVPLSERETMSYHVLDSIMEEYHFPVDRFLNAITKIDENKISIRKLDIDFSKLYGYNRYEGNKLGLGLYTNEKLIKYLSFGGYFQYGFKDKKLKYGGEIEFDLSKRKDIKLKYSYQNTLKEAGSDLYYTKDLFESNFFRNLMARRFDQGQQHRLEGNFQLIRNLKFNATISLNDYNPMYSYKYKGYEAGKYKADNIEFSLKYGHNEKIATLGNRRIVTSPGNPVISIKYTRGTDFMRHESLRYNKINAAIDLNAYNGRIGESRLRVEGGYIDKNLPYGLLFTGEGSKDRHFTFVTNNTFQTMTPYEFLSDKYVNLFYNHNFGRLLFTTKYFKPEFRIAQNMGWGNLNYPEFYQDIDFKIKNKLYIESGLVINNIMNFNYFDLITLGFGAGMFYRYGHYQHDKFMDNVAIKLSFGVSF